MPGLLPDSSGFGGTPLPPLNPRDTMLTNTSPGDIAGRVVPGSVSAPRASVPRDTFIIQRSMPAGTRPVPPTTPSRDTSRTRVDSVKSGGVIIRRDTLTS
jgi:hypothetical protein